MEPNPLLSPSHASLAKNEQKNKTAQISSNSLPYRYFLMNLRQMGEHLRMAKTQDGLLLIKTIVSTKLAVFKPFRRVCSHNF